MLVSVPRNAVTLCCIICEGIKRRRENVLSVDSNEPLRIYNTTLVRVNWVRFQYIISGMTKAQCKGLHTMHFNHTKLLQIVVTHQKDTRLHHPEERLGDLWDVNKPTVLHAMSWKTR